MVDLLPESLEYLKAFNSMPAMEEMEPQRARDMLAQTKKTEASLETLVGVEDQYISVSTEESIKARIYTPKGTGPFSVILYFHGGGWVTGSLESSDPSCRLLAYESNRVVVSVDYRLAPENKFPVPVEDGYTSLNWIIKNASELNVNISDIVIIGDSAGGNIAASVAMMSKNKGGPKIVGQVLLYPITSLHLNTDSYSKYAEGFGLSRNLMEWFCNHYIKNEEDRIDPYAALILAEDFSEFPPSLIITSEYDVLHDEGKAFADQLIKAGVKTEYITAEGLVHGYFTNYVFFKDQIKSNITRIVQFLNTTT